MTIHRHSSVLIDWAVLRELFGDDHALQQRLLALFVSESQRDVEALGAALQTGTSDGARMLAHQLSGAARTIGARSIADAARALEELTAYEDGADAAALYAVLSERVRAVHELIRSLTAP